MWGGMPAWKRGFRRPGHPFFGGAPLLIAHRGGAELAPENTMAAFRQAVDEWDADILEMDVRLTSDGRVVVIHDETVDRTTDGRGPIRNIPWAKARRLDAAYHFRDLNGKHSMRGEGVRLPLFAEVLEAFPQMRIIVEPKAAGAAAPLVRDIRAAGAEERVLVGAQFEATRAGAHGYEGPWGATRKQATRFWILHHVGLAGRCYTPAADGFQLPEWSGRFHAVTPRLIRAAHAVNMPVYVWTVNDPHDMRRLLGWGADGIMTDRPDILAEVLEEVAERPSPPARRPGGEGSRPGVPPGPRTPAHSPAAVP